jgi:ubiquinone/menaquinone biosynthesis C-methylase UbiE
MTGQSFWQQVGGSAAERYEHDLVPAIFASWAPILVDTAKIQPGDHVLDVACGTGAVTRIAAERVGDGGRVVGLDVNASMLGVARTSAGAAGASIEWCEGSALELPLPDAVFDVVLCQQGLQQFPDRPAALAEMRRVLKSGGRIAAAVWAEIEYSPGFDALVTALGRHVGEAAANNRRAPFALSSAEELERLVREAGFLEIVLTTQSGTARFPSVDGFLASMLAGSPLAALGEITDETVAMVAQDMTEALQPYVGPDGLVFPMQSHLVTARK